MDDDREFNFLRQIISSNTTISKKLGVENNAYTQKIIYYLLKYKFTSQLEPSLNGLYVARRIYTPELMEGYFYIATTNFCHKRQTYIIGSTFDLHHRLINYNHMHRRSNAVRYIFIGEKNKYYNEIYSTMINRFKSFHYKHPSTLCIHFSLIITVYKIIIKEIKDNNLRVIQGYYNPIIEQIKKNDTLVILWNSEHIKKINQRNEQIKRLCNR